MIVPFRDAKLTRYELRSVAKPVHFLSSSKVRSSILELDNHILTKRVALKTCADKEYVIAFFDGDVIDRAKQSTAHPYFVNTRPMRDLLTYALRHDQSLLVMDREPSVWHKIDPHSPFVDVFYIEFSKPKAKEGISLDRDI